jgi:hypothetical protein
MAGPVQHPGVIVHVTLSVLLQMAFQDQSLGLQQTGYTVFTQTYHYPLQTLLNKATLRCHHFDG